MNFGVDWEAMEYHPGQRVELISKPGTFDTIASYDPMMVPSIELEHDPRPRYPHELRVVSPIWTRTNFSKSHRSSELRIGV